MIAGVFVRRLKKLNEDITQHVSVTERDRQIHPRLGMLVLARLPCEDRFVLHY